MPRPDPDEPDVLEVGFAEDAGAGSPGCREEMRSGPRLRYGKRHNNEAEKRVEHLPDA